MKFDVELVGKIGSMALIAKQAQIPDYTRIARLSRELKPGYIWVTSGATEIGRLDYLRRHGRELEGKMEDVKADYSAEGQSILMSTYRQYVDPRYSIRQVLVEHQHFNDPLKREFLKSLLLRCKEQNAIPIVNYNDAVCAEASRQEIVRRYFAALVDRRNDKTSDAVVGKLEFLMQQNEISVSIRKVVAAAREKEEKTGGPACAIELNDGTIVTGKTSRLLGAVSAMLLNALKTLAGIDDKVMLLLPSLIEPIQRLKTVHLGGHNPRLHSDEILIALSISAVTNPVAALAMESLSKLKGTECHSTVILSQVDVNVLKKLGVNYTADPIYQTKKLYHAK